jgi:hypothetical protein
MRFCQNIRVGRTHGSIPGSIGLLDFLERYNGRILFTVLLTDPSQSRTTQRSSARLAGRPVHWKLALSITTACSPSQRALSVKQKLKDLFHVFMFAVGIPEWLDVGVRKALVDRPLLLAV